MDFKIIDGGVCAPKGFKANGVYCGIKKSASAEQNPNAPHKNDLGMIVQTKYAPARQYTQQTKLRALLY